MFSTLLYFILALMILVLVHEYGHFIVARWCGVKVLRFSFGFGKVLARWRDKRGTEYAWSLIPLGGYIKMLDESEGPVDESERHLAFNNKSIWARIAIVVAGPLFNFIFAFIALWLVLVIGIKSFAPIIGHVAPNSIAAQAGLDVKQEILAVNGQPIASWRDFQYAFMPLVGTQEPVLLTVKSTPHHLQKQRSLSLQHWQLDAKNPDLLDSLGITPFVPTIPPIVAEVMPNSPAQTAGFQVNDVVVSVNNQTISDWLTLVAFVKKHPNQDLVFVIKRQKDTKRLIAHTTMTTENGQQQGSLGLRSQTIHWPESWLRVQRLPPLQAVGAAFKDTVDMTATTFILIGRLIKGQLSLKTMSGPVGIAKGAGESGRGGFVYYLSFLALVSISLGVLNLLPIPMLDGGHLLYYILELGCRRPVSDQLKTIGTYLGLVFLIALTLIALLNDVSRLTS